MYIPKDFEVNDKDEIYQFIEKTSFGQLISNVDGRIFSTHLPFMLSNDQSKIICHIAKRNPQHKYIEDQEVLISLQGEHAYISPSWYAHKGVPTWNYQAVHIYGECAVVNHKSELITIVESLTKKYESQFSNPWSPSYPDAMLSNIVGIEMTITEIQCKYKLNQNRAAIDRQQVVEKLRSQGLTALARAMGKNKV